MKKIYLMIITIVTIAFLTSCARVDNPSVTDNKTEDVREEVKTKTEKTEEIKETEETKVEKLNEPKEKVENTEKSAAIDDEIIKDAKIASDISDDEIDWIVNTVKIISDEDFDAIKKLLGGSAKEFAEGM